MAAKLLHATPTPGVDDGGGGGDDGLDLDLRLTVGGRATVPKHGTDERADGIRAANGRIVRRGEVAAGKGISMALEAQMLRSRARDRAAREEEAVDAAAAALSGERPWRGNRDVGGVLTTPGGAPISTLTPRPNSPDLLGRPHYPFPVMYPYQQPVRYVPVSYQFGVPCVMPCCGTAFSPAYRAVARGGLTKPARARVPSEGALDGGKATGATEGRNSSFRTADSSESNSSTVSHHQSGSVQGGGSMCSDENSRINTLSPQATEKPTAPPPAAERAPKSAGRAASVARPAAPADEQRPRMPPLVSTTGDGPDGRTVSGFLHRYSDSGSGIGIRILCVCHGSSFTPAEFVRHAGGTNVAQPLRQIVVISHELGRQVVKK